MADVIKVVSEYGILLGIAIVFIWQYVANSKSMETLLQAQTSSMAAQTASMSAQTANMATQTATLETLTRAYETQASTLEALSHTLESMREKFEWHDERTGQILAEAKVANANLAGSRRVS